MFGFILHIHKQNRGESRYTELKPGTGSEESNYRSRSETQSDPMKIFREQKKKEKKKERTSQLTVTHFRPLANLPEEDS